MPSRELGPPAVCSTSLLHQIHRGFRTRMQAKKSTYVESLWSCLHPEHQRFAGNFSLPFQSMTTRLRDRLRIAQARYQADGRRSFEVPNEPLWNQGNRRQLFANLSSHLFATRRLSKYSSHAIERHWLGSYFAS